MKSNRKLSTAEKQIISCLSWFRTRYALFLDLDLNRPASKENLESFGQFWIGALRADWSESFESLVSKGVLTFQENGYDFTEKGNQLKQAVESETPFFKYEYDNFFRLEQNSQAHQQFCRQVYGNDLSQHGLTDQQELELLIDKMKKRSFKNILDIGCGNGKITEYLSTQIQGRFTGIDISAEGNKALWEYRYREAKRYANWGDDKYTRYLYEISK